MYFITFLRFLWALPVTLLGVVLAGLCGASIIGTYKDTVLVVPRWGPVFWLFQYGHFVGFTLGHVIFLWHAGLKKQEALLVHEYTHTRQVWWFGAFYLLAYPLESLRSHFAGTHRYYGNRFELHAEREEAAFAQAVAVRSPGP